MAAGQSHTVYKGESKTLLLTISDSDGVRLDITGFTIEFQVKLKDGDADPPLISKSVGSGITILTQSGGTLGQATVKIDSADTTGLTAQKHRYDVIVIDLVGDRQVVVPPSNFWVKEVVNQA